MKIIFTIQDITWSNGTERTTSLLANEFSQHGHEVTIVSVFRNGDVPAFELNPEVKVRFVVNETYSHSNGLFTVLKQYWNGIIGLRKYFRTVTPDVIIGQAFLCNFFLWITGNSKRAIACEHFKYGMYNSVIRFFRNNIYKKFKNVVVLTEKDVLAYKSKHVDAFVIPNMVSFPIKDIHSYESKRLISVGRLHEQKGYDLLLQALKPVFEKYPDWNIDIFGEGRDRGMLDKLMEELQLTNNVHFPGFSKDIKQEYSKSSFYVMSSRYEGFPMVLLEAMSCGLPVVSFDCPEGPGVLLADNSGILVPAEDVNALSEAIIKMIENPVLRKEYSMKSLEVAARYSKDEIYSKWMQILKTP